MKRLKPITSEEKFYEELVSEVTEDFAKRQKERLNIERQWELNLNYLAGNQYCEIAPNGEVEEEEKYYFWQHRNAYNHIAPIMDTRIARLIRARPVMDVRASGDEESDLRTAKLTSAILNSTCARIDMDNVIYKATMWSETLGTAFYKITWDNDGGKYLGKVDGESVYEGDVKVEAVSPFEIFPDSLCAEDMEKVNSIIHAKAVSANEIQKRYGVIMKGEDIGVFTLDGTHGGNGEGRGIMHDAVLLIERFERPTEAMPNGRVIVVAQDKLLYIGELPYENGVEGRRDFPFVRQTAISKSGSFFGSSIIERLIPIQRSYNAVKNRKEEFLNRLSMGVMTVEDGSIDTDELREEGLSPGKVIVYRQGSTPPQVMSSGNIPNDLVYEEERLLNEFIIISGVSEFSRSSQLESGITSGIALQLLIDQEDARMMSTIDNMRRAVKLLAKNIIRLYKQFATNTRIMKSAGDGAKVELYYFNSSDLSSDDVIFGTDNEISYTPAQKKSAIYELVSAGILSDESGKMSQRTKAKVLDILGFGSMDNVLDLEALHQNKASGENITGFTKDIEVDEYDDHKIHIAEHTRFLLSSDSEKVRNNLQCKKRAIEHLQMHKKLSALSTATEKIAEAE